jgi:hypothetical protein
MNLKQDARFEGFRLDRRNQELQLDSGLIAPRFKETILGRGLRILSKVTLDSGGSDNTLPL